MMVCVFSTGCTKLDELKVKAGLKNTDFEYIKQGKIKKIVIRSTRDQGFGFVVADKKVMDELYNILSTAKAAPQKSSLEPDYVFEMVEGSNKVHKFNYVAGLDKKDSGNLYGDDKIYVVSKRIDNDIIKSYWTIREPKDFKEVYYGSIIEALNQYLKDKDKNKAVGINLKEDVESAKFILSTELESFKEDLKDKFKNVSIADKDKENYDVWMTVKTQGYKSTLYKATAVFWDKAEKSEKKYYIYSKYENNRWNVKISAEKPNGF
ncbi:hypothetical protein JMF89_01440 [Clostridiaceae bacterium UIB06]|uniref:YhfM-like domain-containing protein n=1 Tax=Clostridium thailandense TaxID=2794346 RepID=A0A949TXH8_9CLOT|nr:hypothetical protein [Clostridium thailandense]MBV7272713.1 hypothetical protein [Clostridium thailandense]MCH5135879.1 hypothetical protein [Clostridiaceae bacterium UIB06]